MLKNIDIIDYKCFKDFKLDGIKKINIISGGNNVGKTALLEALFIENKIEVNKIFNFNNILPSFATIAKNRDINTNKLGKYLENIRYFVKSNRKAIDVKVIFFYELSSLEKEKIQSIDNDFEQVIVSSVDTKLSVNKIPNKYPENLPNNYINSSKPQNRLLVELYSKIQTKGIQHKFLEYLKILDKNISWIEPQLIDDELLLRVNLNNPENSLSSSELGEGVNRYIEILAVLLSNTKESVFIDEIENGIHYSKLKDICKAIIEIVQKEDIQLFLTTHDKETIEAFSEACDEMNFKDICSIELYKENNMIKPIVRNAEQFRATVEAGMDIR